MVKDHLDLKAEARRIFGDELADQGAYPMPDDFQ